MQKFIWLWKHRHCWEQLKYLYEQRMELKRILRSIHINADAPSEFQADPDKDPQTIDIILECLREFDRVPLAREWEVSPPPRPNRSAKIVKGGRVTRTRDWPAPPESNRPNALIWLNEKPELLKTHEGWFVAYQDGTRVALEPDCDKLTKAVDEALGAHRRPVTFHEIIDQPVIQGGPSPRMGEGIHDGTH